MNLYGDEDDSFGMLASNCFVATSYKALDVFSFGDTLSPFLYCICDHTWNTGKACAFHVQPKHAPLNEHLQHIYGHTVGI